MRTRTGISWDFLADTIGMSRSQRPMSIRSDIWGRLGVSRHSSPHENIRASVTLIKRITDRIDDPTPEKVGTLWNSISQEKVTIKGARIGRIYLWRLSISCRRRWLRAATS